MDFQNSVIAHVVMHKIKYNKGKNGLTLLKCDLKKAYEKLEWPFLDKALDI